MLKDFGDYFGITIMYSLLCIASIFFAYLILSFVLKNFGIPNNRDSVWRGKYKKNLRIIFKILLIIMLIGLVPIYIFGSKYDVWGMLDKFPNLIYGFVFYLYFYVFYFISAKILGREYVGFFATNDEHIDKLGFPAMILGIILFVGFFMGVRYYGKYKGNEESNMLKKCASVVVNPYAEYEIQYDGYNSYRELNGRCPSYDKDYIRKYYCDKDNYGLNSYSECMSYVKDKLGEGCDEFEDQKNSYRSCIQSYCNEKDWGNRRDCFDNYYNRFGPYLN